MDDIQSIVLDLPSSQISNWDDFEKLVHHAAYNEARIAPEEHPFILSESSFANPASREKITQIMFETFNVPALSIVPTSVLSVAAAGLETGLSLHFGETGTELVPVVDGTPLRDIAIDYPINGSHTKGYLAFHITKIISDTRKTYLNAAKNKCFVSQDPVNEKTPSVMIDYGEANDIDLADAAWKASEVIFYPEMVGVNHDPLALTVIKLLAQCPARVQSELCSNIIVSGGNAKMAGFASRLEKDINFLLEGQNIKVKVRREQGGVNFEPWGGGSLLGLGTNEFYTERCCMKDQYDEIGPTIIHAFVK